MTTTQPRPTVVGTPTTRGPWPMIGMLVIGLLIGLLGGWAIFGGSSDMITVDGIDLTDRQVEMTELIDDHMVAWQAQDADLVLSHYTDTGVFVAEGDEYLVADGSLAGYVDSFFRAGEMEWIDPQIVVDDNTVVSFHTFGGHSYTNVFTFTASGDVLIVRHEVTD